MNGRKYIGIVVFNQNIDKYSKSKKDSLKREIYEKMTSNEYFIKNISVGGGQFLSYKNKNIKLKGNKAFVQFKETISPYYDTYKKQSKNKSMFNWAQKNFKKSMNFNKRMFLDDSLKAVKISVKKDNKTKKKTRLRKNSQRSRRKIYRSRRYKLSRRILRRKKNKTKRKNIKYNQKGGGNIMIYINGVQKISFEMEDNKNIADIKRLLEREHRFNGSERLIFAGKELEDDKLISELEEDGELTLIMIPERFKSKDDGREGGSSESAASAASATTEATVATVERPIPQRDEISKITIFIKLPDGRTIHLVDIRFDEYLRNIKRILESEHSFNGSERLIFAGKELEDGKQISEYNEYHENEISLVARHGKDPLEINVSRDGKYYVYYCGLPLPPEDIDKDHHCRSLTEKLQELIHSGNIYNLYLSLGSNCLHYMDMKDIYTKCMDGQVRLPRGWGEPRLINKVFIIDYGIDIERYKVEVSKYGEAEYEIFNMLWLDDAPELIETLSRFIEYNKTPKDDSGVLGKCLCINYVKFSIHRDENPIFENLIKLFNGVDNFGKNKFDKEYCINNRTLYLDHIYMTGTSTDITLVEFNNKLSVNRQINPITDINSIDKSLSILPYYFKITPGPASATEPEIIF